MYYCSIQQTVSFMFVMAFELFELVHAWGAFSRTTDDYYQYSMCVCYWVPQKITFRIKIKKIDSPHHYLQ